MTKKVVINSKRIGNKNINSQKNIQEVYNGKNQCTENENAMANNKNENAVANNNNRKSMNNNNNNNRKSMNNNNAKTMANNNNRKSMNNNNNNNNRKSMNNNNNNNRKSMNNNKNEKAMTDNKFIGIQGQGQTYGSKKIILDPPPKDVIVKIADIDRDIIIDDVKMVNEGANVSALIIESITYYTAKPFPPRKDKKDDEDKDDKKDKKGVIVEGYTRDCIAMDGVVRSAITVIPCLVYVNLPGCSEDDEYEIVDASIQSVNTGYILRNEEQCEETNLLFNYYEGIIEEYVVTINMDKQ